MRGTLSSAVVFTLMWLVVCWLAITTVLVYAMYCGSILLVPAIFAIRYVLSLVWTAPLIFSALCNYAVASVIPRRGFTV